MTFAEMGSTLGISRKDAYTIVQSNKEQFAIISVADRKRITKESFERWYASQSIYCKAQYSSYLPSRAVLTGEEPLEVEPKRQKIKPFLPISEAAGVLHLDERKIYRLINNNAIEAKKIGLKWYVGKESIHDYLRQK